MVTQEELAAIFYGNRAMDLLTIHIKDRIWSGEEVEAGAYTAVAMECDNPDLDATVGYTNCGLDLDRHEVRKRRPRRRAQLLVLPGIKTSCY